MRLDSFNFGAQDFSLRFVEKINRSSPFVSWGMDNMEIERWYDYSDFSPIHSSAIRTKVDNAVGNGWVNGDQLQINSKESLNDVAKQMFWEYVVGGNLFLEVVWKKDRREGLHSIHVIPSKYMRAKTPENGEMYSNKWLWCHDWLQWRKSGLIEFCEFDPQNYTDRQVIHIKNYSPGYIFYGVPSYLSSILDIRLSRAISEYNLSSIMNGAQPSLWINFPQEVDSQNEQEEILRRLQERYSGPTNAGRVIVSYGSDGVRPEVTTINPTLPGGMFSEIFGLVRENILSGHQIPDPSICGLPSPSGFASQAEQLKTAHQLFMKTTIFPLQSFMSKELSPVINLLNPSQPIKLEIEQNQFIL